MPSYDYSANIPFTITTGGLGTDNLSAWTNELTRQQFEVTRNTLAASFPWVTRDRFVFDFGDGNSTTAKTFSASHIYKYPGIYTVSVFGFTSAGETVKSSQTLSVTAGDFIAPRLESVTTLTNGQLVIKAGNKKSATYCSSFVGRSLVLGCGERRRRWVMLGVSFVTWVCWTLRGAWVVGDLTHRI